MRARALRKPQYPANEDEEIQTQGAKLFHIPQVDTNDIKFFGRQNEMSQFTSVEVKDSLTYDDVTVYGLPRTEQHRLWDLEIDRLLASMAQREEPLFTTPGFLGNAAEEGFRQLSDIADQLICNLSVTYYDTLVAYEPSKASREKNKFHETVKYDVQRLAECLSDNYEEDVIKIKRPTLLPKQNREVYYLLVDYITATVSRYFSRCATSNEWHKLWLVTIAKTATKLKILEKDPGKFATISLENADYKDDERGDQDNLFSRGDRSSYSSEDKEADLSTDVGHMYRYIEWIFRETLYSSLMAILKSLCNRKGRLPVEQPTSIDIVGRVYSTGLSEFHADQSLIYRYEEPRDPI